MCAGAGALVLLAALSALAGNTPAPGTPPTPANRRGGWCAGGEVVTVLEPGGAGGAGGAGPAFAPRQLTDVLAPVGHAATLDCRVLRLQDKSVSWVRSRDLQILSHAGVVFTADARVSALAAAGRHTLRIERLRATDAGRYECQVNTEPKMSLFFNLSVVDEQVPSVVVSVMGESTVRGPRGGAATLACAARYEPAPRALRLPPLDIRWLKGEEPVSVQGARGGVALDTQRWEARVESRLTLAELAPRDAGRYTCVAAGLAAQLQLVLLDDDDRVEAMQRDQASGADTHWDASALCVLLSLFARLLPHQ